MTTCLSVIRPPLKPFSKPMRKGEYYSHDLLDMAAYGILGLQRTKENEEKVLNLHNHLICAPIRGRVNPLSKRQA